MRMIYDWLSSLLDQNVLKRGQGPGRRRRRKLKLLIQRLRPKPFLNGYERALPGKLLPIGSGELAACTRTATAVLDVQVARKKLRGGSGGLTACTRTATADLGNRAVATATHRRYKYRNSLRG